MKNLKNIYKLRYQNNFFELLINLLAKKYQTFENLSQTFFSLFLTFTQMYKL